MTITPTSGPVLVTGATGYVGGWCIFVIADLDRDDGWDEAVTRCAAVFHVASPLGVSASGDAESLVRTAVDGTRRVVAAAIDGGVQRVVMTSAANTSSPTAQR